MVNREMTIKLFTSPLSMFGAKAQIAALEKGVAFELIMVPFDRHDAYEPMHPSIWRMPWSRMTANSAALAGS